MTLKSVEQEWTGFSAMIFDKCEPSPKQVSEMKKAFFAGYYAMFAHLDEISEPHISEDVACRFIDERKAECQEFARRLLAEYAESN